LPQAPRRQAPLVESALVPEARRAASRRAKPPSTARRTCPRKSFRCVACASLKVADVTAGRAAAASWRIFILGHLRRQKKEPNGKPSRRYQHCGAGSGKL